jgi:AcrR family transcriptional regulator
MCGKEGDEGNVTTSFQGLDPAKRSAIVNAALKEFARKGFEDASTNEIVRNAGISKGLLFHYFSTKKDLFHFLIDYSATVLKDDYRELLKLDETDLFARYRQAALLKFDIIHKHPYLYDFLGVALATEAEHIREDTIAYGRGLQEQFLDGIDLSRFRRGIDIPRALKLIGWAIEGYATQLQQQLAGQPLGQLDYTTFLADFDAYLDVLKTCFYEDAA